MLPLLPHIYLNPGQSESCKRFKQISVVLNPSGRFSSGKVNRNQWCKEIISYHACVRNEYSQSARYAVQSAASQFELGKSNGNTEFYEGMAYVAISRANVVEIIGDITVELLNIVNSATLIWWNSQKASWTALKSDTSLNLKYRNTVHESNQIGCIA